MTSSDTDTDARFWKLFGRVLGRPLAAGHYARDELGEWDSLRHIELVFELEQAYGIEIDPEAIVALYSDTDTVLAYLRQQVAVR